MKPSNSIWSLIFRKATGIKFLLLMMVMGCNVNEEPAENIYKAKPQINSPPPKQNPEPKQLIPIDSAKAPIDTLQKNLKDTTETLHRIEKKPEVKMKKRYFYLNIHKKPLIT